MIDPDSRRYLENLTHRSRVSVLILNSNMSFNPENLYDPHENVEDTGISNSGQDVWHAEYRSFHVISGVVQGMRDGRPRQASPLP